MMREYVSNINPGNEALKFIDTRLSDDNYRGNWSSQHNRFKRHEVHRILTLLHKYAPRNTLLPIRTTDLSRRPENFSDEADYARFCDEVKAAFCKGTQDAMRKNLFPDFHRMGLIERFGPQMNPTDPFSRQHVAYVSLSERGDKFIQTDALDEQLKIFSGGVGRLLGGFIEVFFDLLGDPDFNLKRISIFEFMFFVSAIRTQSTFNISVERCVKLIKAYRRLSNIQRRSVIETLTKALEPKNFDGPKTSKRDFGNWKNKAEQIYHILAETIHFEVHDKDRDKELLLRKYRMRSFGEKDRYFKNHRVNKSPGFELHHVVPLGWAESDEQFKIFDNWQNMVYIKAYEHAIITQNQNRNVQMTASENDLILSDYRDSSVHLRKNENILYASKFQAQMLAHNRELVEMVGK